MKNLAFLPLALSLLLSACGSAPGDRSGGRVSVGVAVGDAESTETATKAVTAATETTPEKVAWTITSGKGVTFTFMTRPGSDAVYIRGYRVLEEKINTSQGIITNDDLEDSNKMDLYLTSGFNCAERTALQSCPSTSATSVPANGTPAQHTIYLESGLGSLARATNGDVTQVTSIEFYGTSSNGAPVTVRADGVVSTGVRAGDE